MLQNPLSHPLHFFGLELVFAAAFVLTLAHAVGEYRAGDRWPLFQWLSAVCYGIIIELVAFNFWNNYDHGQFTVQLYHRKLPLYVTLLYPALHYTGLKLVEPWRLGRVAEPLIVGLVLMIIDVPFDTVGPNAGWWRWSTQDPNMAIRWLGVPITSYYWYLLFGAIYAALLRALRPRLERRRLYLLWTPLAGAAVLLLGMVAFIPFHLLKAAGLPPEVTVAVHILAVGILAWTLRPAVLAAPPAKIRAAALMMSLWPVLVLAAIWSEATRGPARAAALAAATLALAMFVWPIRGRAAQIAKAT